MPGSRDVADVQAVSWMRAEDELHAEVARLKVAGVSREERADRTAEARDAVLAARSRWFALATQGRGKPLSKQSHGTGKKPGEK